MKPDSSLVDTVIASPYGHADPARTPIWIVLHTTETAETDVAALAVARMFEKNARSVNSHYLVSPKLTIQCVPERLCSATAGHTGNLYGIHIEMVGRASQKLTDWHDASSTALLERLVLLIADIAARNEIPPTHVEVADAKHLAPGLLDHDTLSKAFGETDHYDVGESFPWTELVTAVRAVMFASAPTERP